MRYRVVGGFRPSENDSLAAEVLLKKADLILDPGKITCARGVWHRHRQDSARGGAGARGALRPGEYGERE